VDSSTHRPEPSGVARRNRPLRAARTTEPHIP
jgi:hypothetical protein